MEQRGAVIKTNQNEDVGATINKGLRGDTGATIKKDLWIKRNLQELRLMFIFGQLLKEMTDLGLF